MGGLEDEVVMRVGGWEEEEEEEEGVERQKVEESMTVN